MMTDYTSRLPDIALSDQSITERVFAGLETRPSETVLIDGPSGRSITASEFIDQVKRLAGGLNAKGLGKGHTIALMAPNMPEFCVVFHGVAWAGGTITTINPTYTATEVSHQLTDSTADILITIPAFLDVAQAALSGTPTQEIYVIGEAEGHKSLDALMGEPQQQQTPIDADTDIVVLPYSSGTTGMPKGVRLSHRNLVINVDQIIAAADFRGGEVAAGFLPFFHIYGMTVLMNLHLAAGGAVVTLPRFDLQLFLQICQDHKSRRMWIVPPVALALAKHPLVDEFDLSNLEQIFSGAAPLGAELSDT